LIVPKLEKQVGIAVYATKSSGIGGVIRRSIEDFVVEEVLVDGSKASVGSSVKKNALGSSQNKNRYLLCVLVKRNWDTISVVKAVADQLGVSVGRVQTAGLKDARAVTAQHITIEDVSTEEIQKVRAKDIDVRPVGYVRSKLSSYYLLGNSFRITISSIKYSKSIIKKRVAQVVEELSGIGGVPNFFGHQRFGTTRPITHLVGKALIKEDFKNAAMLFLAKPSPHEHPASRQAREVLRETKDFKEALHDFPKQLRYERMMLNHLAENSDDYVGAFRRLPKKLQELFPQAYQSYLFNRFLSRRIELGLPLNKAEVGDYVVHVDRSGLPMIAMNRVVTAENLSEINHAIQTGKMRLALPLVGFKQHPSLGLQGEIEKQILEEENVETGDFKIDAMPSISLRGELRAAITPLNNFSVEEIENDQAESSKQKMRMSFTLNRSSYATIILRELIKPRNLIKAGF
jgi:tRNA pseudouridine13 synthase